MSDHQHNKALVLAYYRDLEAAAPADLVGVVENYVAADYCWHGVYPFETQRGAEATVETFWRPLRDAWTHLQRRMDVFMAGSSRFGGDWVCSMGHQLGMFERNWLGIPSTGKMAFLRSCEFHRIAGGRIAESYLHCDLIGVMNQAGVPPLPMQTGAEFVIPGPRTHDGLLFEAQPEAESAKTLALIEAMAQDLGDHPEIDMDPETLARTWHRGMIWYGPSGIGSTMGIDGFKRQHQTPFRKSLYSHRIFNGHKSRFSEGIYGGWVGWPSLKLTVTGGGYLGLPATNTAIDMRVVDIYRREGDKIAENWVFIDTPYTLIQQDLDIFERMRQIVRS